MDAKTRNKIISSARRLSLGWKPRLRAKRKCKVDKALYRCEKCGELVYEGESEKKFKEYKVKYKLETVKMQAFHMDHIKPVVEVCGWTTWDDFFNSLFCDEDNFRGLCSDPCHREKTNLENVIRHDQKIRRKK